MANEAGQGCEIRNFYLADFTVISNRRSSVSGICTRLAFNADRLVASKLVAFAFFEMIDTNTFSPIAGTRVSKSISPVADECIELISPDDFIGFQVETTYYLGCYFKSYQHYSNNGGVDVWLAIGDQTQTNNVVYSFDHDGKDAFTADIKYPTVTLGTTPTATTGTTPTATTGG